MGEHEIFPCVSNSSFFGYGKQDPSKVSALSPLYQRWTFKVISNGNMSSAHTVRSLKDIVAQIFLTILLWAAIHIYTNTVPEYSACLPQPLLCENIGLYFMLIFQSPVARHAIFCSQKFINIKRNDNTLRTNSVAKYFKYSEGILNQIPDLPLTW